MLAGAEERARRDQKRLRESMADSAEQARELADAGLISPEAAAEHEELTRAVAGKLAPETSATRSLGML